MLLVCSNFLDLLLMLCATYVFCDLVSALCSVLCDGSADEAGKRGLLLSQLRASAAAQLFRNLK